jgi:hypothetical protein
VRESQTQGFRIELLPGLPGMSPLAIYQFARPNQSTHSEGAVILVTGRDQSWIGNFQSGRFYKGLTEVCPFHTDPSICVFATGQGYRVRLDSPRTYTVLDDIFPILGAHHIPEHDRIIVWDFIRLAAYSAHALVWRSRRISWDGLSITEVRSGFIEGLAWDAANESEVEFKVDLSTGEHTGGPKLPNF